jgi:hypothetical protein
VLEKLARIDFHGKHKVRKSRCMENGGLEKIIEVDCSEKERSNSNNPGEDSSKFSHKKNQPRMTSMGEGPLVVEN